MPDVNIALVSFIPGYYAIYPSSGDSVRDTAQLQTQFAPQLLRSTNEWILRPDDCGFLRSDVTGLALHPLFIAVRVFIAAGNMVVLPGFLL